MKFSIFGTATGADAARYHSVECPIHIAFDRDYSRQTLERVQKAIHARLDGLEVSVRDGGIDTITLHFH